MCTVDFILRGGHLDEDELINHAIQNQPRTKSHLQNLVKESGIKPWMEVHSIDSTSKTNKAIEFVPSRSLEINP